MAIRVDPVALRKRIGAELRNFRNAVNGSAYDAAEELGCSRAKVSQMEIGMYRLQHRDVRDLLKFYGAQQDDIDRLVELAKQSAQPTWWAPYEEVVEPWFAFFLGSEGEAVREFNYEQQVIPGLVQTKDYAEALTAASATVRPEHRELVSGLRIERQARLSDTEPLELAVVIEETALRRPIGGRGVQRAQLEHLLEMGKRPNISVQVILTEIGAHAGLTGSFIVLEFEQYNPGVYIEHHPVAGARYDVESPDLASTYKVIVEELREKALSPQRSAKFIRTLIAELL